MSNHGTGPRDERLVTGDSGRMLFVLSVGSMALFAGQLVLSPLLPTIIAALAITPSQAGVALTVMRGLVAACRFPGGRLADQLSRKTVLMAAYGVATVGLLLLAVADSYPTFVLGAAVLGVGAGLYMPAALTQVSATFVSRRGQAFGVHEVAVNLGGVIAGGLATVVVGLAVWNGAFVPVIGGVALVAVLMHRWNSEPYVLTTAVDFETRATGSRVLRDRRIAAMLVSFSLMAFVWQGVASFLTTFLEAEKGLSLAVASNAFTALFVVGIVANLAVTPIGDRIGYERTALGSAIVCGLGLTGIVAAPGLPGVLFGIGLFGLGSASFWPLMMASVMSVLPSDSMGGDYGVISTVFMGVGSLGSTYVGVVAEHASYRVAFIGLIIGLLVVAVFLGWLIDRSG